MFRQVLSNRPLLPTHADSQRYVESDAAQRFRSGMDRGLNALVIGEAGSGKTSLLHMAELGLRDAREPVCFASASEIDQPEQAAAAIYRAAGDAGWLESVDEDLLAAAAHGEDPFVTTQLLRALEQAPAGGRMLVDDITASAGHGLFGRSRDELWQLPLRWGVSIDAQQAAGLLTPPADSFFERQVPLEPLDPVERRQVLERRIDDSDTGAELSDRQVDELAKLGPSNPRRLITFARELADSGTDPQQLIAGAERRRLRAEAVGGRPAAMLVAEMEGRGPVSAGDRELLTRLGWTRPRAADLLNRLHEAQVVHEYPEHRRARPGRPRRLFALREPSAFT